MDVDIYDSKCTIVGIKLEATCPSLLSKVKSCYGYFQDEIKFNKTECAIDVKEEERGNGFVQANSITVDAFGAARNVSNTVIATSDIKIKLDFDDDNDSLNCNDEKRNACESGIDRVCARRFDKKKVALKHMTLHAEEEIQGEIPNIFRTNTHIEVRNNECDSFATKQSQHETHDGERNYKCEICNKCFAKKRNYSRHVQTHVSEKTHKCEICDKCFATKQYMLDHMKAHSGERNYRCEICDKSFVRKHHLTQHAKTHSGEKHKCEICGKCFATKRYLLDHLKAHAGERNYKCDVCGKCFARKQHLAQHVKTHVAKRNYECEICDKRFTAKQYLSQHCDTHAGERNYVCEICDKRFAIKRNLSRHVKSHVAERNGCEFCGKSFARKQYMSEHLKVHTGERNFKCEICDKRFTTKQHLSQHSETHTEERNHKCEICGKCFATQQYLSRHVKTHDGKRNLLHRNRHFRQRTPKEIKTRIENTSEEDRKFTCVVPTTSIKEEIGGFLTEGNLVTKGEELSRNDGNCHEMTVIFTKW